MDLLTFSSVWCHRLETNLSNLESENQVLRQQALVASTNEELSEDMKKSVSEY